MNAEEDFSARIKAAIEALEKAKELVQKAIDKFGEDGDDDA